MAPRIDRCPTEVYFPEKDNAKVKVYFAGTSPFDVVLFKDGNEVKENEHIKYRVFDDYAIIYWKEIEKNDMGKYRLNVKNESGTADAEFTLFVTGMFGFCCGFYFITKITEVRKCNIFSNICAF